MNTDFAGTGTQLYSQFIHKSRYARWLEEEKRRETWAETVDRYIGFFREKYPDAKIPWTKLRKGIYNIDAMPSMRAMMTAGPALAKCNVGGYNCLSGDTLVTTLEYGIVPIKEVAGKAVHVVDGNGDWVLSNCRSYGSQELFEVVLSGKTSKTVRATADHRWPVRGQDRMAMTADLNVGDRIETAAVPSYSPDTSSSDYADGVVHGLVYGDGTAQYKLSKGQASKLFVSRKQCKGFSIRLCGDSKELLHYFGNSSVSHPPSYEGDPVVYLTNYAVDLKTLPDMDSGFFTSDYLAGFFRGWHAADGTVSTQSQVSLAATSEGSQFLHEVGPRFGFVPTSVDQYPSETNLGARSTPLYRVHLSRHSLNSDCFLSQYKRDRFRKPSHVVSRSVKSVTPLKNSREEVFCFEVPTTKSFVLTNNILTGNCAYMAIDHPRSFDEMMYILMCGTGVGFSVERQYVNKLPEVSEVFHKSDTVISVPDSRKGWCKSFKELISLLYAGMIPAWDMSKIRPAGERLKTFGGRASGPAPLDELFHFTVALFRKAAGRKLTSLECHDLCCKIAEIVVVGGVRRSALISLSNPSDDRIRQAKSGQWWLENKQRQLANNSACYTEKPDFTVFLKEWNSLYKSKSGERGFFSRKAAQKKVSELGDRRDATRDFGCNPCSEIILRPDEFCNLSEVVLRSTDSIDDIKKKIEIATILGTLQSTLTDFKYIRSSWKRNCEDERLLGVSLTGIQDHAMLGDPDNPDLPSMLTELKEVAIQVNKKYAKILGVSPAAAITTVKPSGTVSQLVNSASGIHARYAPFYIRRVRADIKDPLATLMGALGFPFELDVHNANVVVFSFPVRAPEGVTTKPEVTALHQLKLWKMYQDFWCEHKPSCTVEYSDDEFLSVGDWLWNNFDDVSGISFLPRNEHIYQQAPYEEITEEQYIALSKEMPTDVDWASLSIYEKEDQTVGSKSFACAAGACEVVDLVSE